MPTMQCAMKTAPALPARRAAAKPVMAAMRALPLARPAVLSSTKSSQPSLPMRQQLPVRALGASRRTSVAVSAQAASAPAAPPFKWGANMRDLGISVGIGALLWFIPPPAGVTVKAWQLLSVFVGTIVAIITTPLPLGAVAILGLGVAMITKVLTFAQAFSAFASEIP